MPEETQKQYELVCILPPQLEKEGLENAKKEIGEIINRAEGSIDFKEEKKHNLAYPVNKQGQGIYLISQVSILPEKVADISKELKLNKQVLRHLITQIPTLKPEVKKEKPKKTVKKPSYAPAPVPTSVRTTAGKKTTEGKEDKVKLEEIDKKLNEIIEEI